MSKTQTTALLHFGALPIMALALTGCPSRSSEATVDSAAKAKEAESSQAPANAVWTDDIDAAFKAASETGKPVFIDFTGSDWCYWCKLAENNIFSTPDWKAFAADVVCLKVDFPQGNRPDVFTMKKRQQLADEFNVQGYPTLVLATAGRKEIARFMAGRKGAAEFISEVRKKMPTALPR